MAGFTKRFCITSAALALALSSTARADNLLVNPSFESGNIGFTSGYVFQAFIDNPGRYTLNTNAANVFGATSNFGDHTTGTGLMALYNGATTPNVVAWQQTVNVVPGRIYEFSGWIGTPDRSGTFNENLIDLHPADTKFVVNGQEIGTFALPSPSPTGTWGRFSGLWSSGAATTATIQLYLTRTEASGNDITLDDLSFTTVAVPVPAAAWTGLATLTAMAMACMLRKRKSVN
jgi:hypothetical protein